MNISIKYKFRRFLKFLIIFNGLFLFNYPSFLAKEQNTFFERQAVASLDQKDIFNPEAYILDTGDYIKLEMAGLPELSGVFPVGPGGMLYLPEVRNVDVRGYNLKQLEEILRVKYKKFVIEPNIFLRIMVYRPVRVYIHGEVVRPGFYTLSYPQSIYDNDATLRISKIKNTQTEILTRDFVGDKNSLGIDKLSFPTLYDSLRAAQGITSYSDLSRISIIRNLKKDEGNKITTELNLLSLFKDGDQSQNIRIYDNDVIEVKRSNKVISEQLSLVRRSNLNPDNFTVYIGGLVSEPGKTIVPKGAGLNQAIEMAGGKKLLSGKVNFLRFLNDGTVDKRKFNYKKNAKLDTFKNPVLMDGDIINVDDSVFRSSTAIVKTVTDPFVGIYSVYRLFDGL